MSFKHLRLLTAVAVLCLSRSTWGQETEAESIKGELHAFAFVRGEVTLSDLRGGRNVADAQVGGDGRFEFRHVPFGEYRLTVLDASQQPIHQEFITVNERQGPMLIEMAVRSAKDQPPAGGVSAQELLHPPTKKAFKSFVEAQKLSEAGEHGKAAEKLEKAVQLSPDYVSAWINLGAQHIHLKQYEQGIQELAHAAALSKPTAMILTDIAYAQYSLHRWGDGTRSVREALRIEPDFVAAHLLLGGFLLHDGRTRAEGIQHLELAARVMPAARAELERAQHDSAQAVTHP